MDDDAVRMRQQQAALDPAVQRDVGAGDDAPEAMPQDARASAARPGRRGRCPAAFCQARMLASRARDGSQSPTRIVSRATSRHLRRHAVRHGASGSLSPGDEVVMTRSFPKAARRTTGDAGRRAPPAPAPVTANRRAPRASPRRPARWRRTRCAPAAVPDRSTLTRPGSATQSAKRGAQGGGGSGATACTAGRRTVPAAERADLHAVAAFPAADARCAPRRSAAGRTRVATSSAARRPSRA